MKSFRTELEDLNNPVVEKDIIELERKIHLFKEGKIADESFRSLRLARGVYGQRQFGVQMVRIKLPYGKVTSEQLHRIADVSDEYSRGRLHITTRQDIQIHHVSLDRTPQLWADLERDDITLREACGNTVRNVTASETAGIDVKEPFDVTPYADATFKFFLRNSVGQDMGRKFKISFSATDEDTALAFMHDIGLIAKTQKVDGKEVRGFKVLIAGGLGSQPRYADVAYEFLAAEKLIPFIEGIIRVFDRYGERANRNKARFKFLVKDIGLDKLKELVSKELNALSVKTYPIHVQEEVINIPITEVPEVKIDDINRFEEWKKVNVIKQKQAGFVAVGIRVPLGDFYTDKARLLANLIKNYAGNELRFTLRQDILIRHVKEELLPFFYAELSKLGFTELGYNSTLDITACPGTDTCNLGIASSTGIATELEKVLKEEYPQYAGNKEITIKISGCMNSCGQHSLAHIGFQGMSVKSGELVAPALQVLLGGGVLGNGKGRFADKVIKIPSKRGPEALRTILNDYENNVEDDELFLDYYTRQGQKYFYEILKPLSNVNNLKEADFVDWGHDSVYIKAIGVGECAGVAIDLVSTILFESEEKLQQANEALKEEKWSDAIYLSYASFIHSAKALLVAEGYKTNTQVKIVSDFDQYFIQTKQINLESSFSSLVYQIKENEPGEAFAFNYLQQAKNLYKKIDEFRLEAINN